MNELEKAKDFEYDYKCWLIAKRSQVTNPYVIKRVDSLFQQQAKANLEGLGCDWCYKKIEPFILGEECKSKIIGLCPTCQAAKEIYEEMLR